MEDRPPAGALNLLELKGRPRRRLGLYWASVIVSIVVHGAFLAYLLVYARPQGQQAHSRVAGVNVEEIGAAPSTALPRGDREDAEPEAQPLYAPPRPGQEQDAAHPSARVPPEHIGAPLPEDGTRADRTLPLPERLPPRRLETRPAVPGRAPTVARSTTLAGPAISMPARRLAWIAPQARSRERPAADLRPNAAQTVPEALPPLELLAGSGKTGPMAGGSDESRASALDMGARGSPVVAVLPKEAGIAMFAARIIEDAQMLPEDRPAAPGALSAERGADGAPVPPPARRAARHDATAAKAERGDPESAADKSETGNAADRKARTYRANVRAHLASNRPAGAYGSGKAVVAFALSPAGSVRSVRIVQSSGRPSLDQSVLQSVYRASPFPKPPAGLKPEQLRFTIPFEFR